MTARHIELTMVVQRSTVDVIWTIKLLQLVSHCSEGRTWHVQKGDLRVKYQCLVFRHVLSFTTNSPYIEVKIPRVDTLCLDHNQVFGILVKNSLLVPATELDDRVVSRIGIDVEWNGVVANFALIPELVHEVFRPIIKVRCIRVNSYEPTEIRLKKVRCTVNGQDFLIDGSFSVHGPKLHVHHSVCFYTLKSDCSNAWLKTYCSINERLCLIEAFTREKPDTWALSCEVNFRRIAYIAGTVWGVYSDLELLGCEENGNLHLLSSQQDIGKLLSSKVVRLHVHVEKLSTCWEQWWHVLSGNAH